MVGENEPEATGDRPPSPAERESSPQPQEHYGRRNLLRIVGPSLAAILAVWLMVTLLGFLDRRDDDESAALPSPSGAQESGQRDRETGSANPSAPPLSSPD